MSSVLSPFHNSHNQGTSRRPRIGDQTRSPPATLLLRPNATELWVDGPHNRARMKQGIGTVLAQVGQTARRHTVGSAAFESPDAWIKS